MEVWLLRNWRLLLRRVGIGKWASLQWLLGNVLLWFDKR